jgi:alkylation response protein AidB-like acyl-CoA dehydrogenase
MDLAFTPDELAFREEIRAWVKANLPSEISQKVHSAMRLSRDDLQRWAKILGKKGWLGWGWPEQFGGPGWTAVQKHLFEEECALAGAPRVVPFGPVMVAPVIMAFGNAEQQKRFLPGIASGEVWWSQGYSEPGSGSDLASLKTRAERVGDKYIVNGQKTWTTLGQYGEWIFCLVRTSNEGKPQTGISFLLIDMKTPGITVRPIVNQLGEHDFNEVTFDDVLVPHENLLGKEGEGWRNVGTELAFERSGPERYLSSTQLLLEMLAAADPANPRHAVELGRVVAQYGTLREMSLGVAAMLARGENPALAAAAVKDQGALVEQKMPEIAHDLFGGLAEPGSPLAQAMTYITLAVPSFSLRGGTREILRGIIAKGMDLR